MKLKICQGKSKNKNKNAPMWKRKWKWRIMCKYKGIKWMNK